MKKLIVTITSLFFAAGAGAEVFYSGLADGNSDLGGGGFNADEVTGVQPGVGDSTDSYGIWSRGNPDLFQAIEGNDQGAEDQRPDIYGSLRGNSDL